MPTDRPRVNRGGPTVALRSTGLLRAERRRHLITQRGLAFTAECSQATIWKLEAGELGRIHPALAANIASALGRPVDHLFDVTA